MLRQLKYWFLKLIDYNVDYFVSYMIINREAINDIKKGIKTEKETTPFTMGCLGASIRGGLLCDNAGEIIMKVAEKEKVSTQHVNILSINKL